MYTQQSSSNVQKATIGGGCFWCLDAVYRKVKGIIEIESGFCGGIEANPSYELACSGQTGHIEVVDIRFDSTIISYQALLSIFFAAHDPTQTNGQGYDIGPQYRSVIFYHDEEQQQIAKQMMAELNDSAVFDQPIATLLRPAMPFYAAPAEHQDFYNQRTTVPYCQIIIQPKLNKIAKLFAAQLL